MYINVRLLIDRQRVGGGGKGWALTKRTILKSFLRVLCIHKVKYCLVRVKNIQVKLSARNPPPFLCLPTCTYLYTP